MKILVVGGGAREHALCWSLAKSSEAGEIYCAPGNPGIAEVADCLPVSSGETVEIAEFAEKLHIDPTVVSAPFITTVVDGTGLAIYMLIARYVLKL